MTNNRFGDDDYPDAKAWTCKHCVHEQDECPACGDAGCFGECDFDDDVMPRLEDDG